MTDGHTERLDAALAGGYRIERKLEEGGMASVYLAEDLKHERNVALKILRPELAAVIGAELEISDRVSVVSRTPLFELAPFEAGGPVANYDVVDGGERLRVISEGRGSRLDRWILALNVFEELRRRGAR